MEIIEEAKMGYLKDIFEIDSVEFVEKYFNVNLSETQKIYLRVMDFKLENLYTWIPVRQQHKLLGYYVLTEPFAPSPYEKLNRWFYGRGIGKGWCVDNGDRKIMF